MTDTVLLTSRRANVTPSNIKYVLHAVGIEPDDIVMVHSRLFSLGRAAPGVGKNCVADAFIEALLQTVGSEGVILFPTFTFAVCKSCFFDVNETKSEMGLLSECARHRSDGSRTHHPFFSVSILGRRKTLFSAINLNTSFGENSFFDILHKVNQTSKNKGKVKFLTIGVDLPPSAVTYIHSIEEKLAVPYRYHKKFSGIVRAGIKLTPYDVMFFVRDLTTEVIFDSDACWKLLKNEEGVKVEPLGDSFVAMLREATIFETLTHKIAQESDFLCKGGYRKGNL